MCFFDCCSDSETQLLCATTSRTNRSAKAIHAARHPGQQQPSLTRTACPAVRLAGRCTVSPVASRPDRPSPDRARLGLRLASGHTGTGPTFRRHGHRRRLRPTGFRHSEGGRFSHPPCALRRNMPAVPLGQLRSCLLPIRPTLVRQRHVDLRNPPRPSSRWRARGT